MHQVSILEGSEDLEQQNHITHRRRQLGRDRQLNSCNRTRNYLFSDGTKLPEMTLVRSLCMFTARFSNPYHFSGSLRIYFFLQHARSTTSTLFFIQ